MNLSGEGQYGSQACGFRFYSSTVYIIRRRWKFRIKNIKNMHRYRRGGTYLQYVLSVSLSLLFGPFKGLVFFNSGYLVGEFSKKHVFPKKIRTPIFFPKNVSCPHIFPKNYFAPPYPFLKNFQTPIFFRENISDPHNVYMIYRTLPNF